MGRRFRIAMVSDFFCPNTGGVETHIYHLAGCLLRQGHKVVVITHVYGDRKGIRYLSNGLKAFSAMAHEAMCHAWCMGLKTVFTDHSLFGFSEVSAILLNRLLLRYSLINVDRCICVSKVCKRNTVQRAGLPPDRVRVIPNAIHADRFEPAPSGRRRRPPTIVIVSRLVHRKGAGLMVAVVAEVCRRHPSVRFVVAGDGPKRVDFEEMREKLGLEERVHMLGMVPHNKVREVLVSGDIFLNTSLTEAFCIAIVEAASCGLHVVSTNVGGIPEVLPPDLITMTPPDSAQLVQALLSAIHRKERNQFEEPWSIHARIKGMYKWEDVATETEQVYREAVQSRKVSLNERLRNLATRDSLFWLVWLCALTLNIIFIRIVDLIERFTSKVEHRPPRKPTSKSGEKRKKKTG